MKQDLTKQEINEYLKNTFSKKSSPIEIKRAKKLAMSKNIRLGNLRKKICKKCHLMFDSKNSQIKIKKGFKIIKCKCGQVSRYKIK